MTELVTYMVKALVDDKDSVSVVESEDGNAVIIKVAKEVIGKQGRIIKAIRSVVKAASVKLGKNYSVEIEE